MDCLICTHAQSAALLAALPHTPLRTLEARFGVSRSVLQRHRTRGCPRIVVRGRPAARTDPGSEPAPDSIRGPGQAVETAPSGELARVVALLEEIKALLERLVQQRGEDDFTGTVAPVSPSGAGPASNWNRL